MLILGFDLTKTGNVAGRGRVGGGFEKNAVPLNKLHLDNVGLER